LLAVQWHPEEFHAEDEAPDHGLFVALIQQTRVFREDRVLRAEAPARA
jgi:gamma-glutamyl-gamma-aminobutyrate hydrolase PuuD